ncbi:M24 family metallopeptidase [Mesorhizobium sp.]|uniref:M24 family metallopeptidase n=1 Tax=Mesorhizobium sp. TaxID=1871066 RepID=UPI000FE68995|nr:MAG: M24 family metallopeptidase [Mesorhizobium sp.]
MRVRKRNHCPLARTIQFGTQSSEQNRLADVIIEGVDRTLEAAKPGVTCGEVENIWQNVLRKNNLSKDSRVGYPIGIAYPPDWGEKNRQHPRRGPNRAGGRDVLPFPIRALAGKARASAFGDFCGYGRGW